MVSHEETSPLHPSPAAPPTKHLPRSSKPSLLADGLLFLGGALLALLLVWSIWSLVAPSSLLSSPTTTISPSSRDAPPKLSCQPPGWTSHDDPPDVRTFYDDPAVGYTIGNKVTGWDEKRREWLRAHPSLADGAEERVLLLSGSQPGPCRDPVGDHLLLRFFKNKVDYCRINGCQVFYNAALLQPRMFSFWAKLPVVRAAMMAHPAAEWIWWVDSDAAFTDMDFRLPLHRYKNHNLVVHGWPEMVYNQNPASWTSVNAGIFLIRNCQWSMDLIDRWASMGPQSPNYDDWGKTLHAAFPDKIFPESDDQSGLIYLLRTMNKSTFSNRVYLENEFYFEGYWLDIVGRLANISRRYEEMDKEDLVLRKRQAEAVRAGRAARREERMVGVEYGKGGWRRPFVTHFTGCQPCSGNHNQMYKGKECWEGMQQALNFADDQVLRSYGFRHAGLLDSAVQPLPFGYPA